MSTKQQRVETVRAALAANPDGVSFWNLCITANLNIVNCGAALDELRQAGEVEFVEPDLYRLREVVNIANLGE